MAIREIRHDGERLADQLDRPSGIAPRRGDGTEQMQYFRISRRLLQRLPIKRLSALKSSGPMMFERDSQLRSQRRLAPPLGAITTARHV